MKINLYGEVLDVGPDEEVEHVDAKGNPTGDIAIRLCRNAVVFKFPHCKKETRVTNAVRVRVRKKEVKNE